MVIQKGYHEILDKVIIIGVKPPIASLKISGLAPMIVGVPRLGTLSAWVVIARLTVLILK